MQIFQVHVVKFRGNHEISLNKFIKTEIKKKKYGSGLLFPPPGDLSDPGSNPHRLDFLH